MNACRVSCELTGHVAVLEINNPPHNFVDVELVKELADSLEHLDAVEDCRSIVLRSGGSVFCAGANFDQAENSTALDPSPFYAQAMRPFSNRKPIVAVIQGAAIGAGLGLALVADFRVGSPQSRFSANFNRLGIHPGFGISHTLPRVVGAQKAAWMLYTGERISAQQALALGLIDALSEDQDPFATALAMAQEIARSAPGAVQSTRRTLRAGFADHVMQVNRHECAVQLEQFRHPDFLEGVRAAAQRRVPVFQGR